MDELTGSHVSPSTYDRVLERDGECCWLCTNEPHNIMADVHVAQLIDTTSNQWFTQCQQNGTIPTSVTNVDHQDNLVPLCPSCHSSFDDAGFPGMDFRPWHKKQIQKYIDHEKSDYEQRLLLSNPNSPVPRSLPTIDRSTVLYHPLILTHHHSHLIQAPRSLQWPKPWLGEPTLAIHRAASRGILDSNPIRPFLLPGGGRKWQTGVPKVFQTLITKLTSLWAKQPPKWKW